MNHVFILFLIVLSSIAVPVDGAKSNTKQKERCKYYPSCTNLSCGFYHPTLPCKIFPNCKYGDSCAYTHPQCKFDVSCNRINCNFTHTPIIAQSSPLIGNEKLKFILKSYLIVSFVSSIIDCSCSKLQIDSSHSKLDCLQIFS